MFESIGEKLRKLEEEKGIVVRFMIGHRYVLCMSSVYSLVSYTSNKFAVLQQYGY